MKIEIKKRISLLNFPEGSQVVELGKYELEEIPNPIDPNRPRWLVIRGTRIGMTKELWKAMLKGTTATLLDGEKL
jgi:hypothetical protein